MSDFYELLGVSKTSTKEEISKAYKKQALKWHPDRNLDNAEKAAEMFKKIGKAYEVLSDDEKRSIYDRFGEEGLNNSGGAGPSTFNDFGPSGFPFNIFGGMFGMPGMPNQPRDESSKPIVHNVSCTLKETYTGTKRFENIQRNIFCAMCDNTGFKDKKNHNCSSCNGKGVQVLVHQLGPGMIQQSTRTCVICKGTGCDTTAPKCSKCNGNKIIVETVRIELDIKKGLKKGFNYVLKNKGNQTSINTFGDIIIVFDVKDDLIYSRKGNDLFRKINISLRKALLGFEMILEHIDGKEIVIKSTEIIQPFTSKVLPKMGFLGEDGTYGNYYIEFSVVFPEKFSSKQLKALDLVLHKENDELESIGKINNLHHYKLENPKDYSFTEDEETDEQPQNVQCTQQ